MPFLNDYPTLDIFLENHPNLKGFVSDGEANMYIESGVWSEVVKTLQTQYPDLKNYPSDDLYYGFCALCGRQKGSNKTSQILDQGSVILKYGADDHWAEHVNEVAPRIVDSVNLARKILSEMPDRLNSQGKEVDVILSYHFGFTRGTAESNSLKDVLRGFETLHEKLQHRIVIASRVPGRGVGIPHGYVEWETKEKYEEKRIPQDKLISHYKTFGTMYDKDAGKAVEAVLGSIHVDFGLFTHETDGGKPELWTDLALAGLIIHEASHKFLNTDDHAYCHEGQKYISLSKSLRLTNADSFAYTAISLHVGELIKDDKSQQVRKTT
jgi:hypothetical protein